WGAGGVTANLSSSTTTPPTTTTATLFVPHTNVSSGGLVGGARVGVNYQAGAFVFGFEGDITGMALKARGTTTFSGTATAKLGSATSTINYTTTSAYQTTADWASTFTGRMGYTFDRMLAYGKVGVAVEQDGNTEASTTTCAATPIATTTCTS